MIRRLVIDSSLVRLRPLDSSLAWRHLRPHGRLRPSAGVLLFERSAGASLHRASRWRRRDLRRRADVRRGRRASRRRFLSRRGLTSFTTRATAANTADMSSPSSPSPSPPPSRASRSSRRRSSRPGRSSGLLLHPSSLPGRYGIGDLGPAAFSFVSFLRRARQHIWQVLPLGPTGYGDSPYQCFSAFAGNPLLISLDTLVADNLLVAR